VEAGANTAKEDCVKLGNALARDGVGVVIPNYRLSPKVVHPAHIEDVAGAFAWTHGNIAKYGGNPARIFAFGHSAGGHLVSLLATDPTYLKAEQRTPADIRGVISISGVYTIDHAEPFFHPMFGTNAEVCKKASPLQHATGNHPPFLIAYAEFDEKPLDTMALDLHAALKKVNSPTKLLKCNDRDHLSIIIKGINPDDPLRIAIRNFVANDRK